jgi:broad-specificity NMP kinase
VRPSLIVILGYPGTGKLTVASELVRQMSALGHTARLIDNHSVGDLLFPLIKEADGKSPLPSGIVRRFREVSVSVLKTIEELSPPEWSFVFTHHLVDSDSSRVYLEQFRAVAAAKGSRFLPVVLRCSPDTLAERVVMPERLGRKLTDVARAMEIIEEGILVPADAVVIDITHLSAPEAAKTILATIG